MSKNQYTYSGEGVNREDVGQSAQQVVQDDGQVIL
jgi:hypothetical protein